MKEIQLTQGKVAIVDDEDFEYLNQFKWCAAKLSGIFYAVRNAPKDGKRYQQLMHRVINKTPDSKQTDHINGNGLDNRKSNLRTATTRQNKQNCASQKNTTSKHKGISWQASRNKWFVQIRIDTGKDVFLGRYSDETEAAKAYNIAAAKYFGEFAKLNKLE